MCLGGSGSGMKVTSRANGVMSVEWVGPRQLSETRVISSKNRFSK